MEPWDHEKQTSKYYRRQFGFYNAQRGGHSKPILTRRIYETIADKPALSKRKGDIVKMESGYYENLSGDWRDWFLAKSEKKKHWRRNKGVSLHAMDQYAVVANRYKCIKYKHATYSDYGSTIMFLTGNKPCHIRKYYIAYPFKVLSKFPHIRKNGSIYVRMKKPFRVVDKTWFIFDFNLSDYINNLLEKYEDCELTRDMFLSKIKEVWEYNI